MNSDSIRIGIVDDHNLFRKALKSLLSQLQSFSVRIDAASGKELFGKLDEDSGLDVLLIDLNMPGLSGRDCLELLTDRHPHIKALIISMVLDHSLVNELLDMGAYGYLSKSAEISELSEAIRAANIRKVHRNTILTEALYGDVGRIKQNDRLPDEAFFNENHRKILLSIWNEKSTQEIAEEVCLSVSAINKIKQQLKERTGVKSTVGLLKYAIEKKIIKPETESSYLLNLDKPYRHA
jgi:DNA-binding NarL/FixJ family response regulator